MLNVFFKFLLTVLIASTSSFIFASYYDEGSRSTWEVVNEENGIQVLERWVTNDKNLKVKERTGKMTLNCSIEEVIKLIADVERTHLWMCDVESVKKLKTLSDNTWFVHTVLDTPWPFSKQDMVSKYQIERDDANHRAVVFINKEDKLLPPQKDMDRLDTFDAEWVIEQVKENKVKVTFTTKSTQPPKYPSWAQDPVVRKVFFSNLRNFKRVINKA
ncbi:MAG: START domain-containing protein [Salinivirgaceae bacterium]|jgi:hypothetical protein|nr:START domain-containing protein [Salinivirgaceae bacterium]